MEGSIGKSTSLAMDNQNEQLNYSNELSVNTSSNRKWGAE